MLAWRNAAIALVFFATAANAAAQTPEDQARWNQLKAAAFDGKVLEDGASRLAIDAPARAEDAALVPVTIHLLPQPETSSPIRKLTLVIDGNPSPVAATFTFGEGAAIGRIETRVRVDDYTLIHAVAETADGHAYAIGRFVKAAGGCSAPAAKSVADGIPVGAIRMRLLPPMQTTPANTEGVQLMIHHPNNSGMQMDQVTRLYTPAYFVRSIRVSQADRTLLTIDSGISIAENPQFQFDFQGFSNLPLHVAVEDSAGKNFSYDLTPPKT